MLRSTMGKCQQGADDADVVSAGDFVHYLALKYRARSKKEPQILVLSQSGEDEVEASLILPRI
jgi:hypothetical protein